MVIAENSKEALLLGRVAGKKPGSGNGADCLTIVTLQAISSNETNCKVLFWNPKNEEKQKLSDRARRLAPGTLLAVKGYRDTGNPEKFTGTNMKQSGLYQLTGNNGVKGYYLFGTVKKITYGKKSNITYYVPVYSSGGQIWYRASTWGKPDEIRLGDYIVVRAEAVDLHVYNGFTFHDLRRATVEAVKK